MSLPPVNPEPRTAAWLVQELTAARVFEAAQLRPYLQEYKAAGTAGDAAGLADFLADAGLLTPFQAGRVLAGEAAKLVLGPYLLADIIGSGSLGTVFQAVGRADRKRYAVKVLPLRSLWNVHLAKKQVGVFAGLPPHPAVVPFVDIDSAGGFHYLAWPFAEGVTLDREVARVGRLAPAEAVRVMTPVAEGLAVCHPHGIIHGLLKPSNVLLGADGQTRILDLGVGAILGENIADNESLLDTISTANAAMGMLDCCAPEAVADPTNRTPAGDLYSLGCVLYYCLTGSLPFPEGTAVERVVAHQTKDPPPVSRFNPAVPAWLEELIRNLMRKDPAARPASAADVAAALKAGPVPPPAGPPTALPVPPPGLLATPRLVTPAPRPLPSEPRPVKPKSLIDFDLPGEQATEHGFNPADAQTPAKLAEPTEPQLHLPEAPPVRIGLPRPVAITAPPWSGPRPMERPTPPPAPFDTPVAPPADRSARSDVIANPPVEVPPPPRFAASFWFRLRRAVLFWRPPADVVQLTVFGPPRATPGETIKLQVFAHQPGAFESVRTLSRAFHQDGELLASDYIQAAVPRGAEVGLHLSVAKAGVGRSLLQLNWLGQPQPRSFEVHVPWESAPGLTVGVLSAGLDGVLAGRVEFHIQVLPRRG